MSLPHMSRSRELVGAKLRKSGRHPSNSPRLFCKAWTLITAEEPAYFGEFMAQGCEKLVLLIPKACILLEAASVIFGKAPVTPTRKKSMFVGGHTWGFQVLSAINQAATGHT